MRIAILSDSHGRLPEDLDRLLAPAETIIHLGDLGPLRLLDELSALAPLLAVQGNNDAPGLPGLPPERLKRLFVEPAESVEAAVAAALKELKAPGINLNRRKEEMEDSHLGRRQFMQHSAAGVALGRWQLPGFDNAADSFDVPDYQSLSPAAGAGHRPDGFPHR